MELTMLEEFHYNATEALQMIGVSYFYINQLIPRVRKHQKQRNPNISEADLVPISNETTKFNAVHRAAVEEFGCMHTNVTY